jgi:hypothetical protein
MRASECGVLPQDLARAQDQFRAWRARRTGGRIPPPLWMLAVRLVQRYGVSRTATALRLDYYSLKRRAEAPAPKPPTGGPAFVELPSPVGKQGVFELDNGAGATLRVHLVGYDAADVEALTRRFWNAE